MVQAALKSFAEEQARVFSGVQVFDINQHEFDKVIALTVVHPLIIKFKGTRDLQPFLERAPGSDCVGDSKDFGR